MASVGSNLSFIFLFIGMILNSLHLILFGIGLFSLVVIFQLANLPVEYNASSRAKELLLRYGLVGPSEQGVVSNVLSAAACTYVAATLMAVMHLLYYLLQADLLGGSDE